MGIGGTLTSYLILLVMVVIARFAKDQLFSGSKSGTQVGAEIHSPAEPVIVYANPIDKFIAEHHPNAMR